MLNVTWPMIRLVVTSFMLYVNDIWVDRYPLKIAPSYYPII